MPVGNAPSHSPRRDLWAEEPTDRWAMPLGSIAGTRLSLSYGVFFAAAILFAVVLTVSAQPGNVDLPRAAAMGVGFWVAGWIAQGLTQFGLTRLLGLRMTQLNLGVIGVETGPRVWPAGQSLLIAVATVTSLIAMGCLFRLVEGGFQMPVLSRSGGTPLLAPSIGFKTFDSIWRSGAWLCWMQAIFQMYPLPKTMGRKVVGSLAGLCASGLGATVQATIFRRCLTAVALLTLAIAIFVMSGEGPSLLVPKWSLLLLLGLLLWVSSRARDVEDILTAMQLAQAEASAGELQESRKGVVARLQNAIRSRRGRQRVKRALAQERSEAVDAARLDDILNRLHHDGVDSLDADDRAILERVSENLRKQRQVDSNQSHDSA